MSTPPTVTTRRVPPPCWTQQETLALVNAYAARWLSLNRGNLRTSDWDAVSSAVSSSELGAPKSSVQCRHKIEKLRKRYRSEKQRSLAVPGRFISSWDLFPLLDSMNFGSSSIAGNRDHDGFNHKIVDANGFRVFGKDKNLVSKCGKVDGEFNQDLGLNRDLKSEFLRNYGKIDFDDNYGGGFGLKMINDGNLVNLDSRSKDCMEIDADSRSNIGFDRDFGVGYGVKMHGDRNSIAHRSRSRKIDDDKSSPIVDSEYNFEGIPVKTLVDGILVPPPAFKPKNYCKIDGNFNINSCSEHDADYEACNGSGSEFYIKTLHDGDFIPSRSRLKNYGRVDRNFNSNADFCVMNGYGSSSKMRFEKKKKNGDGGVKRGLDPFDDLVSSITLLTERFVKIEELKMQMARETQKIRMEMEMKHNQMILESQQYILDTFVTGLSEKKKKKKKKKKKIVKVELVSPN